MSTRYTLRSVLTAVAIVGGSLAPLPALAGGYGYGYEQPSYQPNYYHPHHYCHYVTERYYDEQYYEYRYHRVRYCN
jgi:hypothetical protein